MSLCSGFMCWNNADTRTDPRRHFEHNGAPAVEGQISWR